MKYWENRQNCCNKTTKTQRLGDLSKKSQNLLNENNIFKGRLAVAENTSSLLKSNTKILNKQLTNTEHRQ